MPTTINDDESRLPDEVSITTESETTKEETPEAKAERERVEKKLKVARKQFRTSASGLQQWRKDSLDDAKFRVGTWMGKSTQWHDGIQKKRDNDSRPCLTVNRMPTFIRQVTNAARQAHLRILVKPVDDQSDPKLAEVLQGMVRNVEVNSFADRVYNTASDKQAEGGLGWMSLATEYANDDGEDVFRLRVVLKRERRPLAIYPDPAADNPDFSDGKFLFKATDVDDEQYEEIAGKKPVSREQTTFCTSEDETGDWFPNGKNRICKWYNREPKGEKVRKALLASGAVVDYPTDDEAAAAFKKKQEEKSDPVVRDRWVQKYVMMARTITATQILEETEWPCKSTPFFAVPGDEAEIDGVRDWRGVVRDSKESGRIYNVHVSALTETVGMGQKAPVVGPRGSFGLPDSTMRKAWETANTNPHAFLEYEVVDIDGKPADRPHRETFDPPIAGIVEAIHQTDQDYKTTAGYHDASLGEQGPQESGKAILARQRQDELGSSHYLDNQRSSMAGLGRAMIELFRVTYDIPTVVRITGKDDRERKVMVFSGADNDPRNEQYLKTHAGPGPMTMGDGNIVQPGAKIPFQLPKGVKEIYDLSVGEFDVEVTTGKDGGTRREQAVESITALMQALPPELAAKFIDLTFLMMDFPTAHQFAERAKTLLPPELQDDEEGADEMPPAAKAKLGQAMQMIKAMQGELQQLQQEKLAKKLETDAKVLIAREANQSKEKIAGAEVQADLAKTEAEIAAEQALTDIQTQLENFRLMLGQQHEARMATHQRVHEDIQGEKDHARQLEVVAATPEPEPPAAGGTA